MIAGHVYCDFESICDGFRFPSRNRLFLESENIDFLGSSLFFCFRMVIH